MLTELHIKAEDESFVLEDQAGNWLQDSDSLEDIMQTAKALGKEHDIDAVSVHLDTL